MGPCEAEGGQKYANDPVSFKEKTLPGTGAPSLCQNNPMDILYHSWVQDSFYPPDKNMRCNILCCLLKAGLDIPNSHCCWGDNWEWMSNPTRAHAWKMRTNRSLKLGQHRASLVAQQIRIQLSMQETRVQSMVWEDPMCRGATGPVHCNCWACPLQPKSLNCWAHVSQLLEPGYPGACAQQQKKPPQWKAHTWQLERSPHSLQRGDPTQPKINEWINLF